ncbi:hypothetical protein EYF80_055359 [Liparis tanakae]|uniref:Uncharacterized protein n=1 Tax=Liparis tanakae TaxID=230148 RepID=A0A4Z2EZU1_9TELE|nr:hypothetical protein EYF80_055359 [Liparis tanakae]
MNLHPREEELLLPAGSEGPRGLSLRKRHGALELLHSLQETVPTEHKLCSSSCSSHTWHTGRLWRSDSVSNM